jgi:hypothetical protein
LPEVMTCATAAWGRLTRRGRGCARRAARSRPAGLARGGSHLADVAAAPIRDALPQLAEPMLLADALHGGVGLAMARGQPGPARSPAGRADAGDVADLGNERRGKHRTNSRDGLAAPVVGQLS